MRTLLVSLGVFGMVPPAWAARGSFFRGLFEGDPVAWIILGVAVLYMLIKSRFQA